MGTKELLVPLSILATKLVSTMGRKKKVLDEVEEEDNNPFIGTTHIYASGINAPGEPSLVVDDKEDDNDNSDIREEDIDILAQTLYRASVDEPFVAVPASVQGDAIRIPFQSEGLITIRDAGDYRDPWGNHAIGYVIEFDGSRTTRRYSEFYSLRKNLTLLLPTIVVPPLPPKHSVMNYIFKKGSIGSRIIDSRKRMLQSFLNDCYEVPEISNHAVFKKFLDNQVLWKDVLNSAPIIILPHDNHLAPPLNPTKPSPLHLLLPSPSTRGSRNVSILNPLIPTNAELENKFNILEKKFWEHKSNYRNLYKSVKQLKSNLKLLGELSSELGVHYNSFSLENKVKPTTNSKPADNNSSPSGEKLEDKATNLMIEKVGHACDVSYVTHEILSEQFIINMEEPLYEFIQLLEDTGRVLRFRKAKFLQLEIVEMTIDKNRKRQRALKEIDGHIRNLTDVMNQSAMLEVRKISSHDDIKRVPTHESTISHVSYPTSNEMNDTISGGGADTVPISTDGPIPEVNDGEDETSTTEESIQRLSASTINANKLKVRKKLAKRRDRNSKQLDPTLLTESERLQELKILERELDKLEEVQKLILRDVEEVNTSTLTNLEHVANKLDVKWKSLLRKISKAMVDYARESLAAWKLPKEVGTPI